MPNPHRTDRRSRRLAALLDELAAAAGQAAAILGAPVARRDGAALAGAAMRIEALKLPLGAALRRAEAAGAARNAWAASRRAGAADAPEAVARLTLRRWGETMAALRAVCAGARTPLAVETDPADPRHAQGRVIDEAYNALHFALRAEVQADPAVAAGAFPDVPLGASLFAGHAHAAWRIMAALGRSGSARLLDVGAGAGSKVAIAARIFAEADGLEIDPGYAAAARRLLGGRLLGNARCIEADALRFDGYDRYDVIYLYLPIRDRQRMEALEERIVAAARPATVLIAPYAGFHARAAELGVQTLAGALAVTGIPAAEAAALARDAERTGPLLPGPERLGEDRGGGVLAPLRRALRLNGFLE
ncbi:MAG: hypothetical protein KatS3mg118_0096 [Paracoccaceae bacterium]|nr:MAG: hypothetical protein KatS3mg118_0096 [Paracoccaceae bacterium]